MSNLYFVIDTDHYAGNFERPMCAYTTGQLGECGVGESQAKRFEDEVVDPDMVEAMEDLIGSEPDDHGCHRPVKIYSTPGWFNNGHGGCFREDEDNVEERALKTRDEAIQDYADNTIRKTYADKKYGNERADEYLRDNLGKPLTRYSAFYSVAIVLNREPTEKETEFLKSRARLFAKNHRSYGGGADPIEITGFRLIRTREVEERIW